MGVTKTKTRSEQNPESGVVTAKGDSPGAGNIMDSRLKAPKTESGNKPETQGLSADVSPKNELTDTNSNTEGDGLHENSTKDKPAPANRRRS